MIARDATRWMAPQPGALRTASAFRVWRWTADDDARLSVTAQRRLGGPDDPRIVAPGFLEPGLALVDGAGRPWCALGRHPRLVEEQVYDESLLVPSHDGAWRQRGVARTERSGTTLRDGDGLVRATRHRNTGWRKEPLDQGDRVVVGEREWWMEAITVGGWKGFWSFLSPSECVGVRWTDARGALAVEASTAGLPRWRGDVTQPVTVGWAVEPDLWTRATMLLLLAAMIDLSDGIQTD